MGQSKALQDDELYTGLQEVAYGDKEVLMAMTACKR